MKKISFIVLYFSFYIGFSQNTDALELVNSLHGEKIEQAIESIKNFSSDTLKIDNQINELRVALAKIYDKEYTQEEIQSLLTFYKSATGKKVLTLQESTNSKVIDEIYRWEANAQGIELIEDTEAFANVESSIEIIEPIDIEKQAIKTPTVPKALATVSTLEDLKKLIKKDVNVIYDTLFLAKLLDVEELVNPVLEVEEIAPEMDIEKKN